MDRSLLYELYQCNFLFPNDTLCNPNEEVGNVQLWVFSSFIQHQVKLKLDYKFHQKCKSSSELWVHGSHSSTTKVILCHYRLLDILDVVKRYRINQRVVIQVFEDTRSRFFMASLLVAQERWDILSNELKHRDLAGHPFFQASLFREALYLNALHCNGTHWLGLWFYFPLIWCSKKTYAALDFWDEFAKRMDWDTISQNLGFIKIRKWDIKLTFVPKTSIPLISRGHTMTLV